MIPVECLLVPASLFALCVCCMWGMGWFHCHLFSIPPMRWRSIGQTCVFGYPCRSIFGILHIWCSIGQFSCVVFFFMHSTLRLCVPACCLLWPYGVRACGVPRLCRLGLFRSCIHGILFHCTLRVPIGVIGSVILLLLCRQLGLHLVSYEVVVRRFGMLNNTSVRWWLSIVSCRIFVHFLVHCHERAFRMYCMLRWLCWCLSFYW